MLHSIPLPYAADASTAFEAIRDLPWAAWLGGRGGRHDILVANPISTLTVSGTQTLLTDAAGSREQDGDPWSLLREQLGRAEVVAPGIPFAGGALGYWGYDLARSEFPLPRLAQDAEQVPEMAVGMYDWAIVFDHQQKSAKLLSHMRHEQTAQELPKMVRRLQAAVPARQPDFRVQGAIGSNFSRETYRQAFAAVQSYLLQGDCYQVNLAQRFSASATGDAYPAYLKLRQLSPAPYAAFLDWPGLQILCASPERFLRLQEGWVETRPIKGTRPRGRDAAEDERLKDELRTHSKDRAENLMIVDLLRNDLGRCCEAGTVHTPHLFEVESFANVHHLVSTVRGRLRSGCDAVDLLRASFPGGSITGAPKRRAMEIIEQLEPHRRGIYCGSIGYIGYDGNMDTNIAIRTLVYTHGTIRCWAGGGIVADSACDAEFQETLDKASVMLEVLRQYGGR